MKREQLMVAAIENGTVIDHIPSDKLFEVIRLLGIEELDHDTVFIGYNLQSSAMKRKSIIKIANRFFSEVSSTNYPVVASQRNFKHHQRLFCRRKRAVVLPTELNNIVRCNNPKCICNNEPMPTRFVVSQDTLTCHYCDMEQSLNQVKLV